MLKEFCLTAGWALR